MNVITISSVALRQSLAELARHPSQTLRRPAGKCIAAECREVLVTAENRRSGPWALLSIADVPPGSYRIQVFHERATEQTLAALSRIIEIPAEGAQLPPLSVSESGYLQLPHKNKYGKDYSADEKY